ncbi:MAG: cell division protein FtsA [Bryobacterales bacterium]|nr:cell division protein FtsA [Bryobacteraceae bacterium]MDW8131157.1 cell division protein FtsA [Bryobacterales bacterium]
MPDRTVWGVGVDAGSDRTRVVVLAVNRDSIEFAGFGESISNGWHRSRIADARGVAESIRQAREAAGLCAGRPVESGVLGAGGSTVGCASSRGGYEDDYRRALNQADVDLVIERAAHVELGEDRMLLHLCLREFSVDGRARLRDPRGQAGVQLQAYVSLITFSTQEHDVLVGAANLAGLAVEETVFEPLAAAYACLRSEQRRGGVALLDMGAESSDLVVYDGDALLLASSIELGGWRFTEDVARGLGVGFQEAETVKLEHGCMALDGEAPPAFLELPAPPGRGPRTIARDELAFILEARAEQLFRWVRRELRRINREGELLNGLALCGGAARLPGLCEMAEKVLGCEAYLGLPGRIRNFPPELQDPEWTTATGLAMYSARLKQRERERRRSFFSRIFG